MSREEQRQAMRAVREGLIAELEALYRNAFDRIGEQDLGEGAIARPTQLLLPSREDVGAMLGITTETASRAVAAFRREGLLENLDRLGRRFRIDTARLTEVAARDA